MNDDDKSKTQDGPPPVMSRRSEPAPRTLPAPAIPDALQKNRRRPPVRDGRWLLWIGMAVIGSSVGAALYQWVPLVSNAFDGWLALALR